MIKIGIMIEYDNYNGLIIDSEGKKYIVLKKDILSNNIKINDLVKFNAEKINTSEEDRDIARFVNKLEKKR